MGKCCRQLSIPALSDAALLLKSQKEHLLFVSVLTDGKIAPRGPKRGDIKTKKTKISKCRQKNAKPFIIVKHKIERILPRLSKIMKAFPFNDPRMRRGREVLRNNAEVPS